MGTLNYKGYTASIEYSQHDNCFVGEVLGLRKNCILFEGRSIDELEKDFKDGVDSYLEACRLDGTEPEKPYSGKLLVRLASDLHCEAAARAASLGISLNEFINRAVKNAL